MLLDTYSKAMTMLSYYAPIFPELFIVLASFVLLMWGVYHRREAGFAISVVSILVLAGLGASDRAPSARDRSSFSTAHSWTTASRAS